MYDTGSCIAATLAGGCHTLNIGGALSLPFHQIHYFNLLFCVGSGLVAAVPGLIDTLYLPKETRAKRVAWIHGKEISSIDLYVYEVFHITLLKYIYYYIQYNIYVQVVVIY